MGFVAAFGPRSAVCCLPRKRTANERLMPGAVAVDVAADEDDFFDRKFKGGAGFVAAEGGPDFHRPGRTDFFPEAAKGDVRREGTGIDLEIEAGEQRAEIAVKRGQALILAIKPHPKHA